VTFWAWHLLSNGMRHDAVLPEQTFSTPSLSANYMGKFCFDVSPDNSIVGNVTVSVKSDHGIEEPGDGLKLFLFSDQDDKWQKVRYDWPTTCQILHDSANYVGLLSPVYNESTGTHRYDLQTTVGVRQRVRHRYWFFALVACNVTTMPRIEYDLHAVNMHQGYQSEFGMDEDGSIALDIFTALGFFLLFWVILGCAIRKFGCGALRERQLLQSLLVAVTLSSFGGFCMLADSLKYAQDGIGHREAAVVGAASECLAKVQLALLQLFVARGRDFLRSPKEWSRRTVVQVGVVLFVGIAVWSEIYEQYYSEMDWSTVVYFYSSKQGALILLLNIVLFIDIVRSTRDLLSQSDLTPQLRTFYLRTACCAGLYFLALPLLVIVAYHFHPWVRRKFVERIEIFSRFLVCGLLAYCLWPTRLDRLVDARLDISADDTGKRDQLASLNSGDSGVSLQPRADPEHPADRVAAQS